MRAIRENHIAAEAMGKDVRARQLELFVLGSALMGMGGAMLVTFSQILDPSGYQPINHTFLVWVMVIVGGAGNNWGAVLGAVLIYFVWILSDPLAQLPVQQSVALDRSHRLGRHSRDRLAVAADARLRARPRHIHRPALCAAGPFARGHSPAPSRRRPEEGGGLNVSAGGTAAELNRKVRSRSAWLCFDPFQRRRIPRSDASPPCPQRAAIVE